MHFKNFSFWSASGPWCCSWRLVEENRGEGCSGWEMWRPRAELWVFWAWGSLKLSLSFMKPAVPQRTSLFQKSCFRLETGRPEEVRLPAGGSAATRKLSWGLVLRVAVDSLELLVWAETLMEVGVLPGQGEPWFLEERSQSLLVKNVPSPNLGSQYHQQV